MANRKKDNLKVFCNLDSLDTALNNDFGGDVLILSSKKDLTILEDSINIDKNYTFVNIKEIYIKNPTDLITDNFGVILIFANCNDINFLLNQIKDFDISTILLLKDFENIQFLAFKPFCIFVLDNYIKKENLFLQKIFYDFSKIQNYLDDMILNNCKSYKKLNIKNLFDYTLLDLTNDLIFDYFNVNINPFVYNILEFKDYDLVLIMYIWLYFVTNDFEKLNLLSESNILFLKTNFLQFKYNLDNLIFQNKKL